MRVFLMFFCIVFLSQQVMAEKFEQTVKVCGLQAQNDKGDVFLRPCEAREKTNNCEISGEWVSWKIEGATSEMMYNTALTAMVADLPVKLRLYTGVCNAGYDKTVMIRITR
jgi:hypothetical protein